MILTAVEPIAEESQVEVQNQVAGAFDAPADTVVQEFVKAALSGTNNHSGLTVRIVGSDEMRDSNRQWRSIDKTTNVLSFPAELPAETGIQYLGDILICAEVLHRESLEQNKSLHDHWAHIVIHGVLHLLGHDHENDTEAAVMEEREREILAELGIADPYRESSSLRLDS